MKQITLDGAPVALDRDDLPVVIHGQEGSGASFFSVMLAVALCRSGQPMLFWSAYPMAKEEFYKEFVGAIHRMKSADEITGSEPQVIVMENGDVDDLAAALPKIEPGRVLFVKNFETIPENLRDGLLKRKHLLISGDMENVLLWENAMKFPTRIFFSPYPGVNLPPLEKYQGYMFSPEQNGIIKVQEPL